MFTLIIEDKHGAVADEYSFEEGEFIIGRSQGCDIILPSDNVSRRHARIYTAAGKCFIEDFGSSNGVYVNGRRLTEAHEIRRSATIRVGDYFLHVEGAPEDDASAERVHGRLLGRNLSVAQKSFAVSKPVNLIGRGKDCTVTVVDPSVSRIHAKVTVDRQGALAVEDLRSSNGTFVNNARVERSALSHGDLLRIGNVEFLVEIDSHAEVPPSEDDLPPIDGEEELPRRSRAGLIAVVVVAVLLVGGGTAALLLSGNKEQPQRKPESDAAVAKPAKVEPDAGRIKALLDEAGSLAESKKWEEARERYKQVLDISPVDQIASQGFNRVTLEAKFRDRLAEARKAFSEGDLERAAPAVRDIPGSSVYRPDAKALATELAAAKGKLVEEATSLCKKHKYEDCSEKYRIAIVIDPDDADVRAKYFEAKKKTKK